MRAIVTSLWGDFGHSTLGVLRFADAANYLTSFIAFIFFPESSALRKVVVSNLFREAHLRDGVVGMASCDPYLNPREMSSNLGSDSPLPQKRLNICVMVEVILPWR